MLVASHHIEVFNDSLDRCLAKPGFLDAFYVHFMASSPEVAAKFVDTDMKRQHRALKASLYTAMLVADDNPAAMAHLRVLAEKHQDLGAQPEHYDLWLQSLLATVREHGGEKEPQVAQAWCAVLSKAIALMKQLAGAPRQHGDGDSSRRGIANEITASRTIPTSRR